MRKGRALKVRFAPHSAAVKVKNLTPWVSNELLEKAFSVFGEVSLIPVNGSLFLIPVHHLQNILFLFPVLSGFNHHASCL
jgi:hypothetical protein